MHGAKEVITPMSTIKHLLLMTTLFSKTQQNINMSLVPYSISLTHPNVSFSVNKLAQSMHSHIEHH